MKILTSTVKEIVPALASVATKPKNLVKWKQTPTSVRVSVVNGPSQLVFSESAQRMKGLRGNLLKRRLAGNDGEVVIPIKQLRDASKGAKSEFIDVRPENSLVFDNSQGAEIGVGFDVCESERNLVQRTEEIKPPPKSVWQPTSKYYVEKIAQAFDFITDDETRYILTGAFVNRESVVATDGRWLFQSDTPNTKAPEDGCVIPATRWLKHYTHDGEMAFWTDENDYVGFRSDKFSFLTQCLEGNYPNYKQVIPDYANAALELLLDPNELASVLKGFPKGEGPKDFYTIHIGKNSLSITCAGSQTPSVPISYIRRGIIKEPLKLDGCSKCKLCYRLNGRYFRGLLKHHVCRLAINHNESPITGFDPSGSLYITMPMRVPK